MHKTHTDMNTLTAIHTRHFTGYSRWLFSITALLLLTILLAPLSAHAAVTAHVDRNTINEGDTFTLNLTVSGNDSGQPDLSVLHQDFTVIGTGQRSEIQIINGSFTSQHAWTITLSPRHTGKLIIPAIPVGKSSSTAIAVTVLPANAAIDNGPDKGDVFIEVNATPDKPYVQAQVLYTVRLYYDAPVRQGTLSDPTLDNAIVQKLGDDSNFETQRGGRHYQVIERRYAIFPQRSGTLEIPPVVFDGAISDPSSRTGDPFFDSFNPATRHVRLRSRKLDIQVATQPASYQGANWLPAQDIELEQHWSPQHPQFRVGEPVTRSVIIHAKGLSASQLPDLPLPNQSGLKLYPDQPQTSNKPNGDTLVSTREQKIAMIPTQAGDITLPAIELNWWDTQAKRQRTAMLPAQTIHVLAGAIASAGSNTATPAPQSNAVAPTTPAQTATAPTASSKLEAGSITHNLKPTLWIILTVMFGVAWLGTLLLWWRYRRPRTHKVVVLTASTDEISEQATRKHIRQACQQHDPQAAKRALLAWARLHWPDDPPLSLGALASRVDEAQFAGELSALDKSLYVAGNATWRADQLLHLFNAYLKQVDKRDPSDKSSVLAPLHLNNKRVAGG